MNTISNSSDKHFYENTTHFSKPCIMSLFQSIILFRLLKCSIKFNLICHITKTVTCHCYRLQRRCILMQDTFSISYQDTWMVFFNSFFFPLVETNKILKPLFSCVTLCPYQMIDIEVTCLEQTLACTFPHRKSCKAQGIEIINNVAYKR